MVPLARRNLLAERGRLLMSIGGVAFSVLLVLIVLSLYRGWKGAAGVFREVPGDLWVGQVGTRDPFRSASELPEAVVEQVAAVPGVQVAIPVHTRRIGFTDAGEEYDVFFLAFDPPAGLPLPSETRERFFPVEGTTTVDRVLAREHGLGVGDALTVLGRRLEIAGVRDGGNPLFAVAFLAGDDGRALIALDGYVAFVVVSAAPGTDADALAARIDAAVPGVEARTSQELADSTSELVSRGFLPVLVVLVVIGLVVGGAVIALTTYTATIEKARDYGVLKAVGASGGFLYRVVVQQSLIVGALGGGLGVGAAALAAPLLERSVPEFVTALGWVDALWVLGAALGVSVVAAAVPARRIDRIDPAMVFRA
ncbi:MAG: ABC transporter permease [Thermoleophilia bacterium]